MLKKLSLLMLALGLSATSAYAAKDYKKMYKVTITNLTTGQPLTPALIAVHAPGFQVAKLGSKSSEGLAALAKDGMTKGLEGELQASKKVVRTATGSGVILPGMSESIMVEANNPHFKLSLVSMLARTNDAITVLNSGSLKLKPGMKVSYLTGVYDAGVEVNSESCDHIPAPPCGNPGSGIVESSFIRPHPGVALIGDLEAGRDLFASKVAKVTIKRVK